MKYALCVVVLLFLTFRDLNRFFFYYTCNEDNFHFRRIVLVLRYCVYFLNFWPVILLLKYTYDSVVFPFPNFNNSVYFYFFSPTYYHAAPFSTKNGEIISYFWRDISNCNFFYIALWYKNKFIAMLQTLLIDILLIIIDVYIVVKQYFHSYVILK